jgi:hypothetical protein
MTHGQAETVQIPFGQVEREDHLTRGVETGAGGHTSPRLNVARAKLLTEQMGGSFELVSEPGAGTRVSLMLKLAPVAAG